MMDVSGKKNASWSVLVPSTTHQRHYSNLERFLQCVTPTATPKFLPQVICPLVPFFFFFFFFLA
ncbi:hypothetical protein OIU76_027233 [Salix suchowensis]|nr:hypothetical protein OIU76_027233 [Salix suchowensis]